MQLEQQVEHKTEKQSPFKVGQVYTKTRSNIFDIEKKNVLGACACACDCYSCFPAGTLVTMADGSTKKIEEVKIGEYLLGAHGQINQVLALDRPLVGKRPMVVINDELVTTPTHPVLKTSGEFAVLSVAAYMVAENGIAQTVITDDSGTTESWILPGLLPEDMDLMQELAIGDVVHTSTGTKTVESIALVQMSEDEVLYNFVMSGSHTYHAQGYVVTGFINSHDFDYRTWQPRGEAYTVETFRHQSPVIA